MEQRSTAATSSTRPTPHIANTPAGTPNLAANGAQGKLTDPNNSLITMGARPYNPTEARFLTVDPIQGGCANPYTYAFGDPLNHPDLTGQLSWCHAFSAQALLSIARDISGGAGLSELLSEFPNASELVQLIGSVLASVSALGDLLQLAAEGAILATPPQYRDRAKVVVGLKINFSLWPPGVSGKWTIQGVAVIPGRTTPSSSSMSTQSLCRDAGF